ncbi:L,D-transpeptidase [Mangrovicoccus algicola]|uniref:L,D-transpeptidase n=1 Tax=Mangrovicoccus algicola TaxID=2771008 RepID=A0A8J6YUZ6_9RHOB|nr:L,D-transpeptidase [Mangrovicoccus algicola]MBE3638252.1 L,D-transpeptidase [Mangrovicoccus algicola]
MTLRRSRLTRRSLLGAALAAPALSMPALAQTAAEDAPELPVARVTSGFRAHDWRDHFDSLGRGAILVDTESRTLHYWSGDQSVALVYPTSVPLSEEMTRRGRTSVTRKVVGPSWAPTPSMLKRNPDWPPFIGPGPDNPLGTHALYLSWKYYRIHGTHDTRKIGRQSSNGCIGLYNEDIAMLFDRVEVGTQVLLI